MQVKSLPHQNNHHDCGLYTLAYMEFFSYQPPRHIHYFPTPPYRAEGGLVKWFGPGRADDAPFLTGAWFKQNNGYMLRFHLMQHLLERMRARAFDAGRCEELRTQIEATTLQEDACRRLMEGEECGPAAAVRAIAAHAPICMAAEYESVSACAGSYCGSAPFASRRLPTQFGACSYRTPPEVKADPTLRGPSQRARRASKPPPSRDSSGVEWTLPRVRIPWRLPASTPAPARGEAPFNRLLHRPTQ